jgi:hypothetical protein
MLRRQAAWRRHFGSVLTVIWELLRDGWQFMYVIAPPRTAVAAEVLFLRKQLAYYQDHNIRPGRLTDGARLSMVLWSRLFDWKEALAIVTPRLRGLASQEFQVVLALEIAGWPTTAGEGNSPADRSHGEGERDWGRRTGCR